LSDKFLQTKLSLVHFQSILVCKERSSYQINVTIWIKFDELLLTTYQKKEEEIFYVVFGKHAIFNFRIIIQEPSLHRHYTNRA
jgi:hypothetical protein